MKKSALKDYISIIFRYSKHQFIGVLILMFVASLLEGVGFALFLPLIRLVAGSVGASNAAMLADPTTSFVMGLSFSMPVILGLIVLVFGLKNIILYLQKFYAAKLALEYEKGLKKDIVGSVFSSQWPQFSKMDSGAMINAVNTQSKFAAETFKILSLLSLEFLNIVVYCVLGFWVSYQSFFLSAAAGAVSYFVLKGFVGRSRVVGVEAVGLKSQIAGHWMTDLTGFKFIKGNNLEEFRKKMSFGLMDRLFKTELRGEKYAAIMDTLPDFLMAVVVAALLYVSFYVVRVPGEKLIVVVLVLYRMNRRLMTFQNLRQRLFLYLPSFEICRHIEQASAHSKEVSGGLAFEGLKDKIVFSDVTFSYDDNRAVLSGLNMEIKMNDFVAIVGKSGSGKTTALDLFLGLLKPVSGQILVDGLSFGDYDVFSWRKKISYVSQDPVMVEGSILDNIRMGSENADFACVQDAARMAHADEFIATRPKGYDSLIGDRGIQLSGGQKQRIALARALYRKPDILVLDEATSALDQESENMIQRALEELAGKLTILVVAHRLSTIQKADKIYVMESGVAVTSGKMEELRLSSAAFQKLYGYPT